MKKKILGFLIAMALSVPAYASIIVSPTKLEVNVNKIRNNYATCSFEVKGDPQKPMRFKAYAGYFTITDDAVMNMNPVSDIYDASKKIRFVPSEFTVPPGKTQRVRVNIANIKNLPEGESRAVLYVEDVNVKEVEVENPLGIGAQLILKTRVAVPIYIDKNNDWYHGMHLKSILHYRDIDLVKIISILPFSQSFIRRKKSFRFEVTVPVIPSSA